MDDDAGELNVYLILFSRNRFLLLWFKALNILNVRRKRKEAFMFRMISPSDGVAPLLFETASQSAWREMNFTHRIFRFLILLVAGLGQM